MAALSDNLKNQLHLHFIVFLFGFTGILGELITVSAVPLVWHRMWMAVATLTIVLLAMKKKLLVPAKEMGKLALTGVLIAFHWITFFHAIKVSNVSITLACLSAAPFFTSLLEPILFRRKLVLAEMLLGLFTIVGISLIFQVGEAYYAGIFFALISAFLAALFAVINGTHIRRHSAQVISYWELLGGFLATTLFLLAIGEMNSEHIALSTHDFWLILILATVCTAYAFIVSVGVMRVLNPFTVVLSINMEPVYGILLAFLVFGESERMSGNFYFGALIILSTVFINAYLRRRSRLKPAAVHEV